MRETVPILRKLWAGDYAHDGKFHKFPATTSSPQPVQDGGPPLWIAARDINSHEFAIEQDCNVQVTPLWNGDTEIESLMEKFIAAKSSKGQDRNPKIMLLHHGYVATDEDDVDAAAKTRPYQRIKQSRNGRYADVFPRGYENKSEYRNSGQYDKTAQTL